MSTVQESIVLNSSSKLPAACPVCSSTGPFSELPAPGDYRLFDCPKCAVAFLYPIPEDNSLDTFYDKDYYGEERNKFYSPIQVVIDKVNSAKWNKLRALLQDGNRMLDIGCGRGTLLKLARKSGIDAWGVERPGPLGHSIPGVLYKPLVECSFPDNHFDLVTIWHVLEHVQNPVETLREIRRILKPNGWLSLAVPNFGGAQAKASGPHWFHLDLPRHIWHFRTASLQRLMEQQGFAIRRTSTLSTEYDWYGTLQSWMNRSFDDNNRLYALLKREEKRPVMESLRRLAIASILAGPALVSSLLDAVRGDGGSLSFIAQKTSIGNNP